MAEAKPSLLLVGNFLSGKNAGSRSVSEDLAERLRAAGWQIVTTSDKRQRLARLSDMLRTAWSRRQAYRVANVEIYSGAAFIWAEAVCLLLRRIGKPYILTLHGGNLPVFARRHPGRVRRLLASGRAVTTPSRYLLENLRTYRQDLRLLPNPIDLDAYPFTERAHPAPRLIWLRAFHAIYNPALAVQVAAALRDDFPNLQLIMVGRDDGAMLETRELVNRLGLADQVTLPGGVPKADVPTWLNRGDIFLNTTRIDNTPISILEAMACGLCIVSTDVGGIPYLLRHEQDALLVPSESAEAMTNAVKRLLAESELAGRLSRNARAAVTPFDWPVILPQWEQLFCSTAQHEA
jgi:glycosyltransferase involved in cell wall biosynthesis